MPPRVSDFMQREMMAINFGAPVPGKEYGSKLQRHYSLEAIPTVRSRYAHPASQRRRASHFAAGTMTLLDHRQKLAASRSQESLMSEMTASHFEGGQGATLVASAENTTRLPHGAKDPRGSEWINDRAASFDLVYGPEHDGKVAEDHFLAGGAMEATGSAEAEARLAERQRLWDHALAERAHADASYAERSHMGHEQAGGKAGDTYAPGWEV